MSAANNQISSSPEPGADSDQKSKTGLYAAIGGVVLVVIIVVAAIILKNKD